jgi:hypothetical protein
VLGLALEPETVRVRRGGLVPPASELVVLVEERPAPGEERPGWEAYAQWCPLSDPVAAAHSAVRPEPAALVALQVSAAEEVLAGLPYEPEVLPHP